MCNQPKIKFNELISTHSSVWNLDETVINALRSEYNQTIVDIFQNSIGNELKAKLGAREDMAVDINVNNDKQIPTVWAPLDANLRSILPYFFQRISTIFCTVLHRNDDCEPKQREFRAYFKECSERFHR